MTATTEYTTKMDRWYRWIARIADRTSQADIERHIVKHFGEFKDGQHTDRQWLASMYNLLEIYERKLSGGPVLYADRLERLENKARMEPDCTQEYDYDMTTDTK